MHVVSSQAASYRLDRGTIHAGPHPVQSCIRGHHCRRFYALNQLVVQPWLCQAALLASAVWEVHDPSVPTVAKFSSLHVQCKRCPQVYAIPAVRPTKPDGSMALGCPVWLVLNQSSSSQAAQAQAVGTVYLALHIYTRGLPLLKLALPLPRSAISRQRQLIHHGRVQDQGPGRGHRQDRGEGRREDR